MNVVHEIAPQGEAGRVERKRDARAAAILDEAMAVLAAEGLEALTLARLGKSLGVVPAALYRYFPSKDALLAALQRRAIGVIHAGLRDAFSDLDALASRASPEVATLAKLLGGARFYLDLPRTHPQAFFLVALLVGDPRPLVSDEEARRTAPLLLELLRDVDEVFRAAEGCGALDKGESASRTLAFWAQLQGALSLEKARRIAPSFLSATEVAMSAVAAMLVGWGASAAHVKRAERMLENGEKKARA